jgi:cathepsin D
MISLPLVALALFPFTLATPQPLTGLVHVPIMRRSQPDRVANLPQIVEAIRNKYGFRPIIKNGGLKRGNSAAIPITDEV